MTKVLFYASVEEKHFDQVGFYRQDIQALKELGFEVQVTNSYVEALRSDADIYFVWWWTRALPLVVWARLTRRPCLVTGVFNMDLGDLGSDYKSRSLAQRLAIRSSLKGATINLILSDFEIDQLSEAFPNASLSKASLEVEMPESIDLDAERDDFYLAMAWSGSTNLRRKCVIETLQAIAELRKHGLHLQLRLTGNLGDGQDLISSEIERLGIADLVKYLGYVTEDEKIDLMANCRAFISPSRFEGFGLAIAEAMASGAPVVTSPVGSIPEVTGGHVQYCDGGEVESVAEAIAVLEQDAERRAELGRRGSEYVRSRFGAGSRATAIGQSMERLGIHS